MVAAVACGGAPPEAAAPDAPQDAPSDEAPAEATREAEPDGEAPEKPAPRASEDAAPVSVSNEDVQKVLQLVLDDEALEVHLHLGQPGRFPLKVAGKIPSGIELTKATKPVVVVSEADAKEKPVVVFTEITVDAKQATVRYRFDAEGIRGSATLRKGEFGWELASSRVVER